MPLTSHFRITMSYMLALGLIAALALVAYLSLNEALVAQESAAAVMNISGQQRMLSQRIALLTLDLSMSSEPATRNDLRQKLRAAIDLMRQSHQNLLQGNQALRLPGKPSTVVQAMYFDAPLRLDARVQSYLAHAEALLSLPDGALRPDNSDLRAIRMAGLDSLLTDLDTVVTQYGREIEANVMSIEQRNVLVFSTTLLILMIETGAIFRPMARRIKYETAVLAHERNLLHALMDSMPEQIYFKDRYRQFMRINKVEAQALGLSNPADAIGKTDFDFYIPEIAREAAASEQRIIDTGEPLIDATERQTLANGRTGVDTTDWDGWFATTKAPLIDSDGTIIGIVGITRNITTQIEREAALRASEDRFRSLVRNLHVGVVIQGPRAEILLSNPAALDLLGLSEDQLLGRTSFDPMWNVIHEDGAPFPAETHPVVQALASGQPVRGVVMGIYRPAHSDRVWLLVDAEPEFSADGTVKRVVATFSDISGMKRAELALREQRDTYDILLKSLSDLGEGVMVGEGQRIVFANDAACTMLGYSQAELLHLASLDLVAHESQPLAQHNLRLMSQGYNPAAYEGVLRHKLGHNIPIEAASKVTEYQGHARRISVFRDSTARKQAEQRLTAAVAEKEVLIQEIHHRVKNNLQIIASLLKFQSEAISDPQTLAMLRDSQNRVKSMALVHEHLYQAQNLARINLDSYIRLLLAYLARSFNGSSASITLELDIAPVSIEVDTAIPCGLIINELVSNCFKYAFPHDQPGIISVSFQTNQFDRCTLSVCDNGIGMPSSFDITTVESLGLQLVVMLTEQLGGELVIEQREGTAVTISFQPTHPLQWSE